MNEIITVNYDNETVSARDLYDAVNEGKERFSKWFSRQLQFGFKENVDFYFRGEIDFERYEGNRLVVRKMKDYNISIDMAIFICKNIKYHDVSQIFNFLLKVKNEKPIKFYKNRPRFEYEFGDMLDKITGYKWNRQVPIDKGRYYVDFMLGYELAVEYDEEHHRFQIEKDTKRQEYIQNWLSLRYRQKIDPNETWKIPFVRVVKGEELSGIKRIMDYLLYSEIIYLADNQVIRTEPFDVYKLL